MVGRRHHTGRSSAILPATLIVVTISLFARTGTSQEAPWEDKAHYHQLVAALWSDFTLFYASREFAVGGKGIVVDSSNVDSLTRAFLNQTAAVLEIDPVNLRTTKVISHAVGKGRASRLTTVIYAQYVGDIRVARGQLSVGFRDGALVEFIDHLVRDLDLDLEPKISQSEALQIVLAAQDSLAVSTKSRSSVNKEDRTAAPNRVGEYHNVTLEIWRKSADPLSEERLAWRIDLSFPPGPFGLPFLYWVDAQNGEILDSYNGVIR